MRPLRHLILGESREALVEVTSRTVHGRFLMLPSTVANTLILGTLGRAQERYGVKVGAFAFLANHYPASHLSKPPLPSPKGPPPCHPEERERRRISMVESRIYAECLVDMVEEEVRQSGKSVLGAEKVLRQDPHAKPTESKREPAPDSHAATREMRNKLRNAYRQFEWASRESAEALRRGDWSVPFPLDCFPPRHPSPESLSLGLEPAPVRS